MKIILVFLLALVPVYLMIIWGGFYPVAFADDSYILARTWEKAQSAAQNFSNAKAKSAGSVPINFKASENSTALQEVRRSTLTFLIEDAILKKEGEKLIRGFERLSKDRISNAVQGNGDLSRASELVYGLNLMEFQELVLLPQARRDTAREVLAERQVDFDPWFGDIKKKAKVRLWFVPFRWDGEMVR